MRVSDSVDRITKRLISDNSSDVPQAVVARSKSKGGRDPGPDSIGEVQPFSPNSLGYRWIYCPRYRQLSVK